MQQNGDAFGYDDIGTVSPDDGIISYRLLERGRYYTGDAIEVMDHLSKLNDAHLIYLDDAWARPSRNNEFGVEYPTHDMDKTLEIIDTCHELLADGGWLIADADDWLLPRLVDYLREQWGDVAESYEGGGFRRVGSVTYTTKDGRANRRTAGEYLTNGGYSVVFAHKGETDRKDSTSARQIAQPPDRSLWGSPKPVKPYKRWVEALMEPGELLVVPCAGTAPAAIGAIQAFGDEANYICIDAENEAHEAFIRRRNEEVERGQDVTDW